jgi:molybdate transport system substrate-binding protein
MRYLARLILVVVLLAGGTPIATRAQEESALTVFAAASLTDAFGKLGRAFEAATPAVRVEFSFGSSSDLAAQLAEGAEADIFASANERQMRVVAEAGLLAQDAQIFAQNRLVVIVPSDNPAQVDGLDDLAQEGLWLVVAAPGVPIRDYTDTMLAGLNSLYGPDFEAAVRANVVSEESNVRQVAAKVALGEADAGIVYISDITPDLAPQVQMIAVPDDFNTLAAYPIAPLAESEQPDLAQAFITFVLSPAGQAILERWNFIPVLEGNLALRHVLASLW